MAIPPRGRGNKGELNKSLHHNAAKSKREQNTFVNKINSKYSNEAKNPAVYDFYFSHDLCVVILLSLPVLLR